MGLEFCSFASGSSGNCYLVRDENTSLLVDCGIAGKHIISGLEKADSTVSDVDGILITHEHSDHIKSIRMMGRKCCNAKVYGTAGTLKPVEDRLPEGRVERILNCQTFNVGGIKVNSFSVFHDTIDPVGYTFEKDGKKLAILTDTGICDQSIYKNLRDCNSIILEANHDVDMLRNGYYPYHLKKRILGNYGHLSNDTAGELISNILRDYKKDTMPEVVLAHLSNENNTPEQAYRTVENILFEEDFHVGTDLELSVAKRSEPGKIKVVG